MCANPPPFLFCKAPQLCRLYNLYTQTFHTSYAWSTGSGDRLASPNPIPFLHLLLLCLVHPLSLPSNPQPLPVRKSAAAVRGPACASYEICICRPFFSGGQVLASVARHSRTQQRHWCGRSQLCSQLFSDVLQLTLSQCTYSHSVHGEKWTVTAPTHTQRNRPHLERRFRLPTDLDGGEHKYSSTFSLGREHTHIRANSYFKCTTNFTMITNC